MERRDLLFVIPARGGSKGIPGKNIKLLSGKPLIGYSIDMARNFAKDEHICVSTDSQEIKNVVEGYGLQVPFMRPCELATDTASTYDVLLHAIHFYEDRNIFHDWIVLLQPTSPFRRKEDIDAMLSLAVKGVDMVVSVKRSSITPYYNCYQEKNGYLYKFMDKGYLPGRQSAVDRFYQKNGSVYIISVSSLKKMPMNDFTKVKFFEMPAVFSVDIDEPLDWLFAETILNNGIVKY